MSRERRRSRRSKFESWSAIFEIEWLARAFPICESMASPVPIWFRGS